MKNSEENLSGIQGEAEPLMTISEVIGLEGPEPVQDDIQIPAQEETPKTAYERWVANPNKDTLYEVTQELKPTTTAVLASLGAGNNPQVAAKARVITAKAVQSYDPSSGASLPTWVSNQLRQLTRDVRQSNSIVHVPDKMYLDGYAIHVAETEFEDEHGREPTLEELADASHLPVKRIKAVRNKMRKIGTENPDTGENEVPQAAVHTPNFIQEALDYVYNDSDRTDKLILEYMTGYGGKGVHDSKFTMQKLKLTPVQLTRRKAKLAQRIQEISNDLESL